VVERGATAAIFESAQDPYTRALLSASLDLTVDEAQVKT
jgi:ABC-type oligopeptide transport system ATPase subunit